MEIIFTKQAEKDFNKIKENKILFEKVKYLLDLIEINPFANPPSYEKLIGFKNVYSRRINKEHRLIYEVIKEENIVKIIRMWSHYEKV